MFDLEEYIQGFDHKQLSEIEYLLDCPECGKRKLAVNIHKDQWHCWVCQEFRIDEQGKRRSVRGAGGPAKLIMWLEGVSFEVARARVGHESAPTTPAQLEAIPPLDERIEIYHVWAPPIQFPEYSTSDFSFGPARAYCHQRGITDQDITDFGLGWCYDGKYSQRIVFPVYERGQLVYWQARATWEGVSRHGFIKSLNPARVPGVAASSDVLFNFDRAVQHDRVVVCEGPIDAIHVGANAVATFGKRITPTQVDKLRRAGVIGLDLCWDGPTEKEPDGAWPEMLRAIPMLSALFDLRLVSLPQGDPGDYTRHDLRQFIDAAKESFSFNSLSYV